MAQATCCIDGCNKPHQARGWCRMHYSRWRRHGDPLYVLRQRAEGNCAVERCHKTAVARGWCKAHWQKWRKYGDPTASVPTKEIASCSTPDCTNRARARGLCHRCYVRWRRSTQRAASENNRTCRSCGIEVTDGPARSRYCSTDCRNKARGVQATTTRICTVVEDGRRCTNVARYRLRTDVWCRKHYARFERHGDPLVVRAKRRPHGEVQEWLSQAAIALSDQCILLPNATGGRLSVTYQGEPMTAARAVWIIAHGDPGAAFVLHTCHRGDEGCINIQHLYLGDHDQNMLDMGIAERNGRKLCGDQVREIIRRWREGISAKQLAAQYGVCPSTIHRIGKRQIWRWLQLD